MSIGRLERVDPLAQRIAAAGGGQGADFRQDPRGGFESLLQLAKSANGAVKAASSGTAAPTAKATEVREQDAEVQGPSETVSSVAAQPTSGDVARDAEREAAETAAPPREPVDVVPADDAEARDDSETTPTAALVVQTELMLSALLAPAPGPVPAVVPLPDVNAEPPIEATVSAASETAPVVETPSVMVALPVVEQAPVQTLSEQQAQQETVQRGQQRAAQQLRSNNARWRDMENEAAAAAALRTADAETDELQQRAAPARHIEDAIDTETLSSLRDGVPQATTDAMAAEMLNIEAHNPTRLIQGELAPFELPPRDLANVITAQAHDGSATAEAMREAARAMAQSATTDTAANRMADLESVAAQARETILAGVRARRGETELQLDPPEWGRIAVRIAVDQHKAVNVAILTERPFVREALEQSLLQLRAALEQQGLQLGQMNVGLGGEQSWAQHLAEWRQLTSAAVGPRWGGAHPAATGVSSLHRTEGFNAIA
ncbi:MAG: flagellar hook-length control protein FliK [Deltaproteobacteria bacterium]|nr:flagellar hook-length control protein FliK [Deltaproteobacteria bacterium]